MQLSMVVLYLFSTCKETKYITVGKLRAVHQQQKS